MCRKALLFIYISIIIACKNENNTLNLIVYSKYPDPKTTFYSLYTKIFQTNLADSIIVIGSPQTESYFEIKIDTAKAEMMNIDFHSLQEMLSQSAISTNELFNIKIESSDSNYIPLYAFASIEAMQRPYKPEIFITQPEYYYYKNREAVKIEIFCKNKNIELLKDSINNKLSYKIIYQLNSKPKREISTIRKIADYEIIKGEIND